MIIDIIGALFTLSLSILNFQCKEGASDVNVPHKLPLVPILKIFHYGAFQRSGCLDFFLKQTIRILENSKPLFNFNLSDEFGI